MTEQLEAFYRDTLAQLPDDFDADGVVLCAGTLPKVPEVLSTNLIQVCKDYHYYGSHYRVERLLIELDKPHARLLGLWVLSALFHNQSLTLNLTDGHSDVRQLRVSYHFEHAQQWPKFIQEPIGFRYVLDWLKPEVSSPFPHRRDNRAEILMRYCLVPEDEAVFNPVSDWDKKNIVQLAGTAFAMVALADFLLSFGSNANELQELKFENSCGAGGVAADSLEVHFKLRST